ncbi:hypothetical protein [Undibacterium sp. Ji50W]|uniref:hypothetical protein n=1 Tax=Undibacterium sp. Ji50W TaxID=3413041 RepID=UPI003BF5901A
MKNARLMSMDEESADLFIDALKEPTALLARRLACADPILVDISEMRANTYVCNVIKHYSKRFQDVEQYTSQRLVINGSTTAWGNIVPKLGERVLVFINRPQPDGSYCMLLWRGHFSVEMIGGEVCAVANWHLLDEQETGSWGPDYLRTAAFFPDPMTRGRVAIPLAILEKHILHELTSIVVALG